MQYMEVPLTNSSQILEGFFAPTPEQDTQPEVDAKPEVEDTVRTTLI